MKLQFLPEYSVAFLTAAVVVLLATIPGFCQTSSETVATSVANEAPQRENKPATKVPLMTSIKDIRLGMTSDDVRSKLGKPTVGDKTGSFYQFSKGEFAQIRFDQNGKTRSIALTYRGKNNGAPAVEAVYGDSVTVTPKDDGSVYTLVRYPEQGYWLSYSKTAGDEPIVTIMMQTID